MENATKALLIAASVLIVIILIAVSIRILSSTEGVAEQADSASSSLEVSIFNSKFTSMLGKNKTGTEIKALLNQIIINNARNKDHQIKIDFYPKTIWGASSSNDIQKIIQNIDDNITSYWVDAASHRTGGGYDANGYLYFISISIQ